MGLFVGYQGAVRCTDGPTPGARALMAWFLGAHALHGGKNLGIFNCRTVRGGSTTSLHGEGRAADLGVNPHGAAYGGDVAEQLRVHSAELGVQCVIWNRRIWSGAYPTEGFRPYAGTNPHLDHVHVELSWDAARTLTAARVEQILTAPRPSPIPRPVEDDDMPTPAELWGHPIPDEYTAKAGDSLPAFAALGFITARVTWALEQVQAVAAVVSRLETKVDRLGAATPIPGELIEGGPFDHTDADEQDRRARARLA